MKGGNVYATVEVGEKSSPAPPRAGGGVRAEGEGVLKGTPGVAATGGFETKAFGKGDSNRPPSPFGGVEGGRGMFKTMAMEGVGPDKLPAISMTNIMNRWMRENCGGSGSQSMPSDRSGRNGNGYLPGAASWGRSPPLQRVRIYLLCAQKRYKSQYSVMYKALFNQWSCYAQVLRESFFLFQQVAKFCLY